MKSTRGISPANIHQTEFYKDRINQAPVCYLSRDVNVP